MSIEDDGTVDLISVGNELRNVHGIDITHAKLYRACLDGEIPAFRVRGRWRLPQDEMPRVVAALGRERRRVPRDERSGRFTRAA